MEARLDWTEELNASANLIIYFFLSHQVFFSLLSILSFNLTLATKQPSAL